MRGFFLQDVCLFLPQKSLLYVLTQSHPLMLNMELMTMNMMNVNELCQLVNIELSLVAALAKFSLADCEDDLDIASDAFVETLQCGFDYEILTGELFLRDSVGLEKEVHDKIENIYHDLPKFLFNAFQQGITDAKH